MFIHQVGWMIENRMWIEVRTSVNVWAKSSQIKWRKIFMNAMSSRAYFMTVRQADSTSIYIYTTRGGRLNVCSTVAPLVPVVDGARQHTTLYIIMYYFLSIAKFRYFLSCVMQWMPNNNRLWASVSKLSKWDANANKFLITSIGVLCTHTSSFPISPRRR